MSEDFVFPVICERSRGHVAMGWANLSLSRARHSTYILTNAHLHTIIVFGFLCHFILISKCHCFGFEAGKAIKLRYRVFFLIDTARVSRHYSNCALMWKVSLAYHISAMNLWLYRSHPTHPHLMTVFMTSKRHSSTGLFIAANQTAVSNWCIWHIILASCLFWS